MSAPDISTPCIKICVVDPVSALCLGCGRSIAEIAAWGDMSEAQRVAVMAGLDDRLRDVRSAVWAALLVALTGAYAYRFEAADFLGRVAAELLPSEPQVGQGGEVIVSRRLSGEFSVAARVNGARVTFLFDTGASMVVLAASDARRAGVDAAGLTFDVPVTTANGAALAAEVQLNEIAVGPIVMRNVGALVARPGALEESLLGMSFLERLKSYTVERGRLILTAK